MINGNNYQALTHNGISQLFLDPFERQEFIIQVIQIFPPRDDNFTVLVSDGFTWTKSELLFQAKTYARKINLTKYTVIKFFFEDICLEYSDNSFDLLKFQVVNSKINNLIGQPVPYHDYQNKKSFINFQSGNMISNKPCLSIREVIQMPVGRITGTILAKIIKKPDKINTVMNIRIEDQEREEIQCCFFGEEVTKYRDFLQWGQWYYFEDPVLQSNNKYGGMIELKINSLSKVIKEKKTSEIQPGIINNNNKKKPEQEYEKRSREHAQLKEFVMRNYKGKESVEEFDLFVIARPLKVFYMKNDQGRNFQCVNKYGEIFDILLWNDCKVEVELDKTYRFDYVRAKIYRDKITLQSQRGRTRLTQSKVRILSRDELFGNKKPNQRKPSSHKLKERYLGSNDIIYSVYQMIQRCQTSKDSKIFLLCSGSLTLRFDYANANPYEAYNDLRKKVFYIKCQKCQENDYVRSNKIELTNMNGKVICNGCKSQKVGVMWNIQAVFMDSCAQVPCRINSQIAEKLLDMTPTQGMILFMENSEQLKLLLQNKLNFKRGVYKFSSKINDKKEGERFYNIWEYYQDGSKVYVERGINQLQRTWALFKKTYGISDKENVVHQPQEEDEQIRMSEKLDRIQLREDD